MANEDPYRVNIINYTTIREIWKMIGGKRNHTGLLGKVHLSKQQYNKLVNASGKCKIDKKITNLARNTGVDIAYFDGRRAFKINNIGEAIWDDYIKKKEVYSPFYSDNARGNNRIRSQEEIKKLDKAKEEIDNFERRLRKELSILKKEDIETVKAYEELYRIYYWLNYGTTLKSALVESDMKHLIGVLTTIDITKIKDLSDEQLVNYINILNKQLKIANAINTIRHYENNE